MGKPIPMRPRITKAEMDLLLSQAAVGRETRSMRALRAVAADGVDITTAARRAGVTRQSVYSTIARLRARASRCALCKRPLPTRGRRRATAESG